MRKRSEIYCYIEGRVETIALSVGYWIKWDEKEEMPYIFLEKSQNLQEIVEFIMAIWPSQD